MISHIHEWKLKFGCWVAVGTSPIASSSGKFQRHLTLRQRVVQRSTVSKWPIRQCYLNGHLCEDCHYNLLSVSVVFRPHGSCGTHIPMITSMCEVVLDPNVKRNVGGAIVRLWTEISKVVSFDSHANSVYLSTR